MATIYNSDLSKELQQGAKLQVRDRMPTELAEKVVPVMEVNPKLLRRCNVVESTTKSTTGTATIWTTPSDKDFYLVGVTMSLQKDAASDSTYCRINATVSGVSKYILYIPTITLTATAMTQTISFPIPILIDKNTAIQLGHSFTVGVETLGATIIGYTVDNIRA